MLLFTNTYGWLGISIGMSLLMLQIICLSFGQFARIISFSPSIYCNRKRNHNLS